MYINDEHTFEFSESNHAESIVHHTPSTVAWPATGFVPLVNRKNSNR